MDTTTDTRTPAQRDLADLLIEGIERFGSVEAFTAALNAATAAREAGRS